MSRTDHHWKGKKAEPDKHFGFVYCITNMVTGKKYLGRKNYWFTRRVKVNGRKNRRKVVKESDWRTYMGSSLELKKDITKLGKDNFQFKILSQHNSLSMLKYSEVKAIITSGALINVDDEGNPTYYNGQADAIRSRPKLD